MWWCWIIFCSLSVDLKGQGHRSPVMNSCENHVLACISEVNEPVGNDVGDGDDDACASKNMGQVIVRGTSASKGGNF